MSERRPWSIAIDRGGTFTDVVATAADGTVVVRKVPSQSASGEHDGVIDAIRLIAEGTLAELRDSSVNFTHARTPSPSTATSITTMLTGRYYSQLYWSKNESDRWQGRILPHEDESVRLAESGICAADDREGPHGGGREDE